MTYKLPHRHLYIRCGILMYVDFLSAGVASSQIADPIDLPSTGVMHLAGPFLSHKDTLHGPLEALVHGKDGASTEFQVIGHASNGFCQGPSLISRLPVEIPFNTHEGNPEGLDHLT
ncbi:MAG: hypothetical protein ACFFD2_08540 [Promethearchaeota archaeon]